MRLQIVQNVPALFLIVLLTGLCFGQTKGSNGQKSSHMTGTYSNMYYNSEGGDVIGDEVRIAYTRYGYQAVLQFAEGEPEQLVVVDVKVVGITISFSVPDSSPYAGEFNGKIENRILKGEFHFKSGGSDRVELKKGKSYWD